jgi:DNA polymerase III subunit epsilon
MYLLFYTETTGHPKDMKAAVTDLRNWPRLVQLAYLFYDRDGNKISGGDFIIRPHGFTIPVEASRLHGITNEKANLEGKPLTTVLHNFQYFVHHSECLVAHSVFLHEKIVGAEFLRNNMRDTLAGKRKICTMQSSINFCAIDGLGGYKEPTVSELYHKLFKEDFEGAQDAALDINATAKCFWELKRLGEV